MKLQTLSDSQRGSLLVFLGAAFFGISYTSRKLLLLDQLNPFILVAISNPLTAIFILCTVRASWSSMWQHFKIRPWQLLGMGSMGMFGGVFFLLAIDHLGLGIASVLEKIQPIFVLFLAVFFLHETLPRKALMWVPVALVSSYFVSNRNPMDIHFGDSDPIGILYVLAAATCWASSSIFGRLLVTGPTAVPSNVVSAWRGIMITVLAELMLFFVPASAFHLHLNPYDWLLLLLGPGICMGIGLILYFRGLRHVTAPVANFLEMSTPVVGVTFGYFLVGETMSATQMAAIPLLFLSVICIANARTK